MLITAIPAAPFGAEVRGWRPAEPLAAGQLAELRQALAAHHVLVVRGHPTPSAAELVAFANSFGEVAPAGEMYGLEFEHREVLSVSNELNDKGYERGVAGSGALPWHSDYSFMDRAGKETFLEALLLPPGGGPDTIFCDMYDAYATLPADLRAIVDQRGARHTLTAAGGYTTPARDSADFAARQKQVNPDLVYPDDGTGAWHPLVMTHPETGAKALYASTFIAEIEGMTPHESNEFVKALLAHAARPERIYRHRWQPHDLVIFDTMGTIHSRDLVRADERRSMRQLSTLLV